MRMLSRAAHARFPAGGTTEDRCFFLYLVLLSRTTVEWMMDRLGLRLCALLQQVPPK